MLEGQVQEWLVEADGSLVYIAVDISFVSTMGKFRVNQFVLGEEEKHDADGDSRNGHPDGRGTSV